MAEPPENPPGIFVTHPFFNSGWSKGTHAGRRCEGGLLHTCILDHLEGKQTWKIRKRDKSSASICPFLFPLLGFEQILRNRVGQKMQKIAEWGLKVQS